MNARVVNVRSGERYDVYIGRPGPWGNPFPIARDRTREEAVEAYRKFLASQPALVAKAKQELKGKVLGCWCSPLACHGAVLSAAANNDCDCWKYQRQVCDVCQGVSSSAPRSQRPDAAGTL